MILPEGYKVKKMLPAGKHVHPTLSHLWRPQSLREESGQGLLSHAKMVPS